MNLERRIVSAITLLTAQGYTVTRPATVYPATVAGVLTTSALPRPQLEEIVGSPPGNKKE